MKVLLACNDRAILNPYVSTLRSGLDLFTEVNGGLSQFRDHLEDYDLVHIQWPEALFSWDKITIEDAKMVMDKLKKFKENGGKIVSTVHNLGPHKPDDVYSELYSAIYGISDGLIHLGFYSFDYMSSIFPDSKHVIIPHHIYDKLHAEFDHESSKDRFDIIRIGVYGSIRNDSERDYIASVVHAFNSQDVTFGIDIPNYYKPVHLNEAEMFAKFMWSNVVLIPRVSILNSGNLPFAFETGNVVIGPYKGNVGDILKDTNNIITHDNISPEELVKQVKDKVFGGLGAINQSLAFNEWTTDKIAEKVFKFYNSLYE